MRMTAYTGFLFYGFPLLDVPEFTHTTTSLCIRPHCSAASSHFARACTSVRACLQPSCTIRIFKPANDAGISAATAATSAAAAGPAIDCCRLVSF
jgi:hypothetical protein